MSELLRELDVLALDCQAGGATPTYGDLLELGWAVCSGAGVLGQVNSRWIVPRTARPIPRAVRELTGWTEACVAEAVPEQNAWAELCEDATRILGSQQPRTPTVIHFARFELPFLRDLHPVRAQCATNSRVENRTSVAGRKDQMMVEIEGRVRGFQWHWLVCDIAKHRRPRT